MLSIYISNGPPKMIKQLKLAYQELGSFLEIDPDNYETILSLATSKDPNSSKMKLESTMLFNKYMELTISERKILFQEIENYVNSLKNIIQNEN
jgi:tRNA(Ser,Leu) C12 N-acetylase TAN1